MAQPIRRWLSGIQEHATIEADTLVPGAKVLSIGGAEQSHVNLEQPGEIFYEYLARIANHFKVLKPEPKALKILHLGAGALTLARWAALAYPGSQQFAVDIERELMDFVLTQLPLPANTSVQCLVADAREVLHQQLAEECFDVIILDIFSGPEAPEHLTTPDYYAELTGKLAEDGILFVNIGDDPPLAFTDSQIAAAQRHFDFIALSGPPEIFSRRYPGNLIMTAAKQQFTADQLEACRLAGPHPSEIRSGLSLDGFGKP